MLYIDFRSLKCVSRETTQTRSQPQPNINERHLNRIEILQSKHAQTQKPPFSSHPKTRLYSAPAPAPPPHDRHFLREFKINVEKSNTSQTSLGDSGQFLQDSVPDIPQRQFVRTFQRPKCRLFAAVQESNSLPAAWRHKCVICDIPAVIDPRSF